MMPTVLHTNSAASLPQASSPAAANEAEALSAPPRIVAATRGDFRKSALAWLERSAGEGASSARIDMSETEELDASGLGILVLLQKRANELRIALELVRVPKDVRHLLTLTKLEHLFRFA